MEPGRLRVLAAMVLLSLGACSSKAGTGSDVGAISGAMGATGSTSGNTGTTPASGSTPSTTSGDTSTGSMVPTGSSGTVAAAGSSGSVAATGADSAGSGTTSGSSGASTGSTATGSGATSGSAGASSGGATGAIHVTGTGTTKLTYNGQPLYLNKDKTPIQGKLFLLLPGIGNGPGAGGFESFVELYGFHVFAPKTDTSLTGSDVPQSYKDTLKTMPNDPVANRQVGDARMELWDGKDRVSWFTPPMSIVDETVAALKYADMMDPGGDWTFFLNDDGTLRTTDVWVVGYSWGAQTWSMISTYVNFGRVIAASGPVDEGFPNAAWMTDPSATPEGNKYMLASDGQIAEMAPNVMKAGWLGTVTMVTPTSPGPYTDQQFLFEMVGGNGGVTPGGHTVFCNDNPMNGWWPVCKHVLGEPP